MNTIEHILKRAAGTSRGDNVWALSTSERCAVALVCDRMEVAEKSYRDKSAARKRLGPDLAAVERYIFEHGVRYDIKFMSFADCMRLTLGGDQAELATAIARKDALVAELTAAGDDRATIDEKVAGWVEDIKYRERAIADLEFYIKSLED